jgi:DNA primase
VSIIDLIEGDGGTLRKAASTHGGEFAGACPWCGGNDRFRVWPEQDGGKYWCRSCRQHGDAIQWLRERRGLSFVEACKVLGHDPGPRKDGPRPAPRKWEPKEANSPADLWREKARVFLDEAVACLWSPRGEVMRSWLHAEKGLQDETIRKASLGYNPVYIYEPRATWGLELSLNDDGTERRQWIPAGLVIPLILGGAVHRLRIRRDPGEGARYVIVSGSSSAPMAWNFERAVVVIVESELDGLLLNQEVEDLAGVVSMGSAQAKPDRITHEALTATTVILTSLDRDEAGARAAWGFWAKTYGRTVKRWPCYDGKDPSAAQLNGLPLRTWVVAGLFGTEERFERFCIQTIDGGLSDEEAIKTIGELVA